MKKLLTVSLISLSLGLNCIVTSKAASSAPSRIYPSLPTDDDHTEIFTTVQNPLDFIQRTFTPPFLASLPRTLKDESDATYYSTQEAHQNASYAGIGGGVGLMYLYSTTKTSPTTLGYLTGFGIGGFAAYTATKNYFHTQAQQKWQHYAPSLDPLKLAAQEAGSYNSALLTKVLALYSQANFNPQITTIVNSFETHFSKLKNTYPVTTAFIHLDNIDSYLSRTKNILSNYCQEPITVNFTAAQNESINNAIIAIRATQECCFQPLFVALKNDSTYLREQALKQQSELHAAQVAQLQGNSVLLQNQAQQASAEAQYLAAAAQNAAAQAEQRRTDTSITITNWWLNKLFGTQRQQQSSSIFIIQ